MEAIDELLAELEDKNLLGDRNKERSLSQRLRVLESEVGLPLPRKVVRARNTARLHSALLDWQEQVLDAVVAVRATIPDAHGRD